MGLIQRRSAATSRRMVSQTLIRTGGKSILELYHSGLTACSKKTRLCLREKGLDYVSHYIDLSRFEQHTPEYLALNPNGLVPTLVHDGAVIIESTVINEYLEDV